MCIFILNEINIKHSLYKLRSGFGLNEFARKKENFWFLSFSSFKIEEEIINVYFYIFLSFISITFNFSNSQLRLLRTMELYCQRDG